MRILIFGAGILGTLLFVVASILGGAQIEGYSLVSQFISESYASGLPNTEYLRYMYVTSGVLLALFGFLVPSKMPKAVGIKIGFFLFAIFYGFGTVTTGFFPCDIGCNPDPEKASLSQFIHNTAGFLTYAMVPFCLLGIGFSSRKIMDSTNFPRVSIICAILAFSFVVLLFGDPTGPFIGLFQRIIEGSVLFWVVYTAFYIQRTNNK
ncbi:DUF998 domain-containing protein [Maribacter algarum]|uniref:DUF998 domain-containing protein n=1 Tax=Maribacter algarum (ex Zhang et al. 2020) TaxID=2578118 RepID=A0A5S3PVX7_9FLAO|nr:DUF998 domain-containing protein [Maribacter algarum]TMM58362.1 DUF998 domain-containing protein [Maribacter algarum]